MSDDVTEAEVVYGPGDPVFEQALRVGLFMNQTGVLTAARFDDIEIDSEMRRPASNTIGAYFRSCYWLCVALRVATHQLKGDQSTWYRRPNTRHFKLATVAGILFYQGCLQAGVNAARFIGVTWAAQFVMSNAGVVVRSSDPKDIRKVYDLAIKAAADAGARKVQRELQLLAVAKPAKDKGGLLPNALTNDDNELAWWVPVVAGVAVGVVGLVFAAPYIASAGTAVVGLSALFRR